MSTPGPSRKPPPSKEEFVLDHFHILFGMMVDCLTWATERDASASSRRIAGMREKVAVELRNAYDQLIPPNAPHEIKR